MSVVLRSVQEPYNNISRCCSDGITITHTTSADVAVMA